jgi:hypothetical protein
MRYIRRKPLRSGAVSQSDTVLVVPDRLPPAEVAALEEAWRRLERPSFAARASSALGSPLEAGFRRLAPGVRQRLEQATDAALERALETAIATLDPLPASAARHRAMTVGLGAAGGFFGPAGLVVELPVTTVLLLRTIADVARREGERLDDLDARIACLEIFALGSPSPEDDAAETGFFELRAALALELARGGGPLATLWGGSSAGAALVQALARRFGVVVTQKAAARAVPVVGAVTGASLNALFFEHYLDVARGHFVRRRLERRWGRMLVAEEYARIGEAMAERGR